MSYSLQALAVIFFLTWTESNILKPRFLSAELPGSCGNQPCVHGVCIETPSGGHQCFCQNGFTGLNCQTNYNDCRSDPCLNDGFCIDGIDEFSCICNQGYTGITCETDINECLSDPCMNSGICEDLVNDYVCHCPLGFTGINCENYFNVCDTEKDLCKNGGSCILGPSNSSTCSCLPNFFGENCELPACPCERGGICIGEQEFSCLCPFGWTGKTCETEIDVCERSICNGGYCVLGTNEESNIQRNITCFCVPDYHGKFCELRYNECIPEPSCENGATCVDDVDGYSCICPAGYLGSTCNETFTCSGEECPHYLPFSDVATSHWLHNVQTTSISPSTAMNYSLNLHYNNFSKSGVHLYPSEQSSAFKTLHTHHDALKQTLFLLSLEQKFKSENYSYEDFNFSQTPFSVVQTENRMNITTVALVYSTPLPYSTLEFQNDVANVTDFLSTPSLSETKQSIDSSKVNVQSSLFKTEVSVNAVFERSTHVPNSTLGLESIYISKPIHTLPVYSSDNGVGRSLPELCDDLHCQNGGTPDMFDNMDLHSAKCKCLCPLLYAGVHCERETYLLIPQFHRPSFLKHALPLIEPEKGLDIDISFKTSSPEGTILFTEAANSGSFLFLYIEHGLLKFRFSCGHQTTIFMETHAAVNNSFFTSVSISTSWTPDIAHLRNASCNVGLLVNGTAPMGGQQFVLLPRFDFRHIYIGGVPPSLKSSLRDIHRIPSLEGCVIFLQINGEEKEIVQDAEIGVGITECYSSACYKNPCLNGATCRSYEDHWNCECLDGFAGPFCEHKTCFANPCEHGSTCLPSFDSGYLCVCPYGKHGKNCEQDLVIIRPSFYGDIMGYSSYIQYQLFSDYHYHLEIRIMFTVKNLLQNSLLLFNGQLDNFHLANDFLSIGLLSGYVIYTFNLGAGTRVLRSVSPLNQNVTIHSVLIGRHRRYCWLEVDSQVKVVGLASGQLTALNTPAVLYIGGHSSYNFSLLPEELKELRGFEGCVFSVELRNSPNAVFRTLQPIIDGRNIQQCNTTECDLVHCANGGTCIDVGSTFQCQCVEGWVGTLCTQIETPCSSGNHKCHNSSQCVPVDDDYRCDCPLGQSGKYCEKNISVSDPLFDGVSSFLSTQMVNVRHSMDVVISFKPLSDEGLLFYAAQHLNELSRDFISLSITSSYIQLRFNLGTDPSSTVVLQSYQQIDKNIWQTVEFGRYRRAAYLKLEKDEEVTSISPPGMEILDVNTDFFIGGVPDLSSLPKEAVETVPTYFKGCVRHLSINSKHVVLNINGTINGRNIEDCDGTSCGYDSCKNNGLCIPKDDGFFCQCSESYRGQMCEVHAQCWQHNCIHGSSCIPNADGGHQCLCAIGWQGDQCERGVNVSSAYFMGASYLLYQDISYRHLDLTKTSISFAFSSKEKSGLLLWNGKIYSEDGDYLGIGLSNNHLHLVWNLGWLSQSEIMTDRIPSETGSWHHVSIERDNKILKLFIDGEKYTSVVSGDFYELNTDGVYYFGGFPYGLDIEEETLGYFSDSFVGCIKDLSISGRNINIMDLKEGKNLEPCSLS